MAMHLAWRERLKNFSSPLGLSSPTVAKAWYSSQRKKTGRKRLSCCSAIFGIRCKTARWKSIFIIVPKARAKPALEDIGKLSAHTLPCSISQSNEGSGCPYLGRPCSSLILSLGSYVSLGGQK